MGLTNEAGGKTTRNPRRMESNGRPFIHPRKKIKFAADEEPAVLLLLTLALEWNG